jgi:sulfhydrogenase subunit beta (sulfur reductase)
MAIDLELTSGDPGGTPSGMVDKGGLERLFEALVESGYRMIGPTVRDGAIVYDELSSFSELPAGWHDRQAPGSYALSHGGDSELFGWAVGASGPKSFLHPPREVIAESAGQEVGQRVNWLAPHGRGGVGLVAIFGVRPCDLAGLAVMDGPLAKGRFPDWRYVARRRSTFLVVAECLKPAANCFCGAMGTGPEASSGFDLAVTELPEGDGYVYLLRSGSPAGAEILAKAGTDQVSVELEERREELLARTRSRLQARFDPTGVRDLLARNLEHPRWEEVAERCLACANCTSVCPTCFCSAFVDQTGVSGPAVRERRWDSCFDAEHSWIHGGAVRNSRRSRYRQWLTHKLSTWYDQFGTSGCVGCGRCITWCPVGIDLREEVAAIRDQDQEHAGGQPVAIAQGRRGTR